VPTDPSDFDKRLDHAAPTLPSAPSI
jgi:hypothetical protein